MSFGPSSDRPIEMMGTDVSGDAALFYETEAYSTAGKKLMGRHAAGNSFLRAAARYRRKPAMWAYASTRAAATRFAVQVKATDSSIRAMWCPRHRSDLLARLGTLYRPDPVLSPAAELRLRQGAEAYSLCGITHTTASHGVMDQLATLLRAPLMPWDAIICTSRSVVSTIEEVRGAEADYLRWRFGRSVCLPEGPMLPIIPLGVHCDDFDAYSENRYAARESLDLHGNDLVVLFVGRLSFHAKAHPDPVITAIEEAATRLGKRITLVHCGWYGSKFIRDAYDERTALSAEKVRTIFLDGRTEEARRAAWSSADIFLSMSDNIQETFGLTPVEAMAAGLPSIVTDWNGYRDTVRCGVDGFRIATRMPAPGAGQRLATLYEAGTISYDEYCGHSCQTVSFDVRELVTKLVILAQDSELRKKMGRAAKEHARSRYDWQVIYAAYIDLWSQLSDIRNAAKTSGARDQAPRFSPARMDPTSLFRTYPTEAIGSGTMITSERRLDGRTYEDIVALMMYSYAKDFLPEPQLARAIADASKRQIALMDLATVLSLTSRKVIEAVAILAKMGFVRLQTRKGPPPPPATPV